jgi:hypothetical protein
MSPNQYHTQGRSDRQEITDCRLPHVTFEPEGPLFAGFRTINLFVSRGRFGSQCVIDELHFMPATQYIHVCRQQSRFHQINSLNAFANAYYLQNRFFAVIEITRFLYKIISVLLSLKVFDIL